MVQVKKKYFCPRWSCMESWKRLWADPVIRNLSRQRNDSEIGLHGHLN